MRALIVDDEEDIGTMAKIILKSANIDVDDIYRVKDARKKIIENQYDLFFLDLNLPDGSGFDLMPLILEQNQNAGIAVISAYDGSSEKQRASEFGVHTFIKKPFTKKEILMAVDKLTQKKNG